MSLLNAIPKRLKRAQVFLIMLLLGPCDASTNMTITQQRDILTLLYHSTGGDNYWKHRWPISDGEGDNLLNSDPRDDLTNPGDFNNPCTWYGVECREVQNENGTNTGMAFFITGINLQNNNLIGFLPWEIFLLPELRRIILPLNNIKAIGLHSSCNHSASDSINLQSDILDDLREEYMSMFEIDMKKVSEVQIMVTEDNQLQLPSPTIVELNLSQNNLTCYNMDSIRQYLPKLEKLDFSMNNLRGTLPDFHNFQYLHTINFASTGLRGPLPPSLLNASRASYSKDTIFSIDLISNEIDGTIPIEFAHFFRLNIFLQNNKIQNISPLICNQFEWMHGEVGLFGCQAILCPPRYFSSLGRQTNMESKCELCSKDGNSSNLYGQLTCGGNLGIEEIEDEETIATWSRLANARFWGYFSLFVFALAGVFTFVED